MAGPQDFEVTTVEAPERAVLVGIERGDTSWPAEESLAELARLVQTAGAELVFTMSQRLERPNPRTFIGAGKADELARVVDSMSADLVVFDDELTPSQQGNLEKLVGRGVKVIDRTALILDIFALHARSREGRLQVRLAQNQYLLPRLRGMWSHLAAHRMGGGVGSRFGEGESQLEVDRRLVRHRIDTIRRELKAVERSRATQRKGRSASGVFRIALAGYTNAGKSSLMNLLTDAGVEERDKLFATLDSTTRKIELPSGTAATLTDTVGFIQKLPHSLVQAFRSTLDEVREADLVCVVADAASAMCASQLDSVHEVLAEIGADTLPQVEVFNKTDLLDADELARLERMHPQGVFVSARTGAGKGELLSCFSRHAQEREALLRLLVPFPDAAAVAWAHEHAVVLSQEYGETGIELELRADERARRRLEKYALR